MARNSKITTIRLQTERRHDHITVEFTRKYMQGRSVFGGAFDNHAYKLKTTDSVERVYEIINHPQAGIEDIDVGTRGDLTIDVDVSGLQNTDL